MRFIVNSKVLFEFIKLAIQFNADRVQARHGYIIFPALREIAMPVEFTDCDPQFDIKFNKFRWQKILSFIHDLPDQFLTVSLYDDRIIIQCEALFVV